MNRTHVEILIAILASALNSVPALAQCTGPFTISSVNADSVSASCSNVSGSTWDVAVEVTHSGQTADLTIQVDSVASINDLVITITQSGASVPRVSLTLQGPGDSDQLFNLTDLASLQLGSGNQGELVVSMMRLSGNLGYMECHGIVDAVIQGDVTDEIHPLPFLTVTLAQVSLGQVTVEGDFLGDIIGSAANKKLPQLVVLGDIGTPSQPSTLDFSVSGNIGSIDCQNLYGDVWVGSSLRRLTATGVWVGDFLGPSISVNAGVGGTGSPGLFVGSGDYDGSIVVQQSLAGDIAIAGDLLSGAALSIASSIGVDHYISIAGTADGSISVGDVLGSLVIEDLSAPLTVVGDVSGSIAIGGVGGPVSISGDITSTGVVEIDSVLAFPLDVGGAIGGSISIGTFAESVLFIGDGLSGDVAITDTDGFDGAIVINANGNADPDRELWSGSVSVATSSGAFNLAPEESQPERAPFYEVLTSTLVGTVGLAPFNFHPKDSTPTHGVSVVTGAPTSVQIRHYGPVVDGDDDLVNTPPVRVFEALLTLPIGKSHHGTPVCDLDRGHRRLRVRCRGLGGDDHERCRFVCAEPGVSGDPGRPLLQSTVGAELATSCVCVQLGRSDFRLRRRGLPHREQRLRLQGRQRL